MWANTIFPKLLKILGIILLCSSVLVCGGGTKRVAPTMGEQLFLHNQTRGYKHRRCGMCHTDIERGILHSFVEQKTDRINPFTGQPFGRAEAICTSCHTSLHLAHPVGIIPNPQKVVLPPEAKGFKGEKEQLTCMSCHDWHPTNTSYKYLRWPVDGPKEIHLFCLHCHKEKGRGGKELAYNAKIRQAFKLVEKSDPYFKDPSAERGQYLRDYQGVILNLTDYVQDQRGISQADETQVAVIGRRTFPLSQLSKAKTISEKERLVGQLGETISSKNNHLAKEHLSPQPSNFKENYELGLSYKQQGKLNNAIVYLKKAIELKPDFPPAYFELGQVYLANQWLDEAQAVFQQAISLEPDFAPAYVGLGNVYEARGEYLSAAKVYQTALRLDPDYGPAYYQLGLLHKRDNQLEMAQDMLTQAVGASSTNYAAAYYELGLIYKARNLPQAEQMFTLAVQKAEHAEACYELGLICKQKGEVSQARDMFDRAVAAKSNNSLAYFELASIYQQQGFLDRATSVYTQATKLDKRFAPAYYQLGVIFLENRQLSDAGKLLSQAIKLNPDYTEALYQLAEVYYQQKNWYKATKLYKRVTALQEDHPEAYLGLGKSCRQLGKLDKAITNLKRAIALRPEYAKAHYLLGSVFKDKGWTAKSKEQFQLALKLGQPKGAEAQEATPPIHKIALYKIATRLDSEDPKVFYNLGVAHMASGRLNEAVVAYQQAIALRPQYKEALYNLALAYKAQKQLPKAVTALQQVIQLKADFIDARYALAETLQAQGQWEQSILQYQQILPQKPGVSYSLAQVYFKQWQANRQREHLKEAKGYFDKALRFNPKNTDARQTLQYIENLLGGQDIDPTNHHQGLH